MKILLATLLVFGLASSEEESSLDITDYVTNLEVSGYRVLTACIAHDTVKASCILKRLMTCFLIPQVTINTADMLSLCLGKTKAQEMITAIKAANCPSNIKDPIRLVVSLSVDKSMNISIILTSGNGRKVINAESSSWSRNISPGEPSVWPTSTQPSPLTVAQ